MTWRSVARRILSEDPEAFLGTVHRLRQAEHLDNLLRRLEYVLVEVE